MVALLPPGISGSAENGAQAFAPNGRNLEKMLREVGRVGCSPISQEE